MTTYEAAIEVQAKAGSYEAGDTESLVRLEYAASVLANNTLDLLAACEAVAEFDDCEDAADWKDAYARLVRGCVAAVRAAKGGVA